LNLVHTLTQHFYIFNVNITMFTSISSGRFPSVSRTRTVFPVPMSRISVIRPDHIVLLHFFSQWNLEKTEKRNTASRKLLSRLAFRFILFPYCPLLINSELFYFLSH
jgi:hypothetical protein